jgi:hypothetical protein
MASKPRDSVEMLAAGRGYGPMTKRSVPKLSEDASFLCRRTFASSIRYINATASALAMKSAAPSPTKRDATMGGTDARLKNWKAFTNHNE